MMMMMMMDASMQCIQWLGKGKAKAPACSKWNFHAESWWSEPKVTMSCCAPYIYYILYIILYTFLTSNAIWQITTHDTWVGLERGYFLRTFMQRGNFENWMENPHEQIQDDRWKGNKRDEHLTFYARDSLCVYCARRWLDWLREHSREGMHRTRMWRTRDTATRGCRTVRCRTIAGLSTNVVGGGSGGGRGVTGI